MKVVDTIAAIATASGNSGIGIIRVSGDEAVEIVDKIFKSVNSDKKLVNVKSHTINYGHIVDNDKVIDEVLVSVMNGPHSYTGEDVVEINCHGGMIVIRKILEIVLKNGARTAEPGEFTKRAFLNGRMDLSQAEAVMDVINAKNEFALSSSIEQLNGRVSEKIKSLRKKIIYNIAFIESALDDPEHISIDGYSDKLSKILEEVNGELSRLINNFDNGRIVKEGVKTVILGKPNAGKSSLLNLLLGEERAIVTDIEGTTRDTLEESINLNGVFLNLIDTAGIRDSEDVVEQIGVNKAKELAEKSDLVIFVADASKELDENDKEIINLIKDKQAIVLLNKSDLGTIINEKNVSEFDNKPVITFSAKTGDGLDELDCQYKFYAKNRVELSHIRDFYGIITDINENRYLGVDKNENIYNNVGCYFSATGFSRAAQEYAWAHNIFLISFEKIDVFKPILENINEFVNGLNENVINTISKEELLVGYENAVDETHVLPDAMVGIVNNVYPIIICGNEGWSIPVIEEAEKSEVGRVYIEQVYRTENLFEAKFELTFMESVAEFSIPLAIVEKLMKREDNPTKENVIFNIDVPYLIKGRKEYASMEVFLEGFEKNQYNYKQISFENMFDNEELEEE